MNNDLLKKVLLKIEEMKDEPDIVISIPDFDTETTVEHLAFLYKKGYIIAEPIVADNGEAIQYHVNGLTQRGQSFLERL